MTDEYLWRILFILIFGYKVLAEVSIVDKGMLPLVKNSIAIQLFIDVGNQNRKDTCRIYTKAKRCCLSHSIKDCNTMLVYGEHFSLIKPRDRKTLKYIVPAVYQHDLIGYCDILLHYTCPSKQDKLRVHMTFDTSIDRRKRSYSLLKEYIGDSKIYSCRSLDENSLEKCSRDCDIKYLGQRSYYDENTKQCIKEAVCLSNMEKALPDVVIVPENNVCKNLDLPLSIQDIYSINNRLGVINKAPTKQNEERVYIKPNCTTISQNMFLIKDLMFGKLYPNCGNTFDYKKACISAIFSIIFCIISICAVLLSFVCCVNTTVWVYGQWLDGNFKHVLEVVKSKFERTKKTTRDSYKDDRTNNPLLRRVVTRDMPIELRNSIVSICERLENEIGNKRRYRKSEVGSKISLYRKEQSSPSSDVEDSRKPFIE